MGYDYSLGYLGKYHEMVKKLVQIAQSGEILAYDSETWEPIRQRHQLVRSLLANMERNMKGYEDIRKTIRTWTEHTPTGFRLYVGKPNHKVTGRPPSESVNVWRTAYVQAGESGERFTHYEKVDSAITYERFVGKLVSLPPNIGHVTARFADISDTPEQREYFDNAFVAFRWKVSTIEGEYLTLERY